ncbi:iron ABC transporter permease [Cohnella lubricantis]|uniref:Iron ABC transporter permease n=1 Tax=Cohnella lubricantis TaxID=2163172 RepID=A0A841TI11_9BACL|nr:iron ABC transporter permease [Cohnella lubricantis]MBB6678870.1 iron ABC transporter permease [Cohnella lubricantis]MBP2120196.1 iron complex transport system permease protein [Cohnella lubricantis]
MSRQGFLWGGAFLALLLLSVVVCLSLGSAGLPIADVWGILLRAIPGVSGWMSSGAWPESSEQIVLQIRMPRVVLAIVVGACLSLAGAGFQGVLRNPLADPYTLGVASGAAVGAAFLMLTGLQFAGLGRWTIPVVAFGTGLLSLYLVLRLARNQGKIRIETLLLSGVVLQAFLGSMVSFMVSASHKTVNDIVFWMMGSLALRGWSYSGVLLPYLLVGCVVLMCYARPLNLFALGERQAAHLGVRVERTKVVVLVVSTLMAAGAVAVAGTIGFVGLVVPHLVRLLAGPDYRLLLPLSALLGGAYMLWSDTIARTLLSPTEIPLGVITAFIGAPFFAYLLRRRKSAVRGG